MSNATSSSVSPPSSQQPLDRKVALMSKIQSMLDFVLRNLAAGNVPSLTLVRQSPDGTRFDQVTQTVQPKTEQQSCTIQLAKRERFTQLTCLLVLVYEGLVNDIQSTKRDLFYKHVALFKSQTVVDRLLESLERTLACERHDLNVTASAKGLMQGPACVTLANGDKIWTEGQARPITRVETYAHICLKQVDAVLVIEKDAVFQTLCQLINAADAAHPARRWLLMTAKGYPDVSSRQALKFIDTTITQSSDPAIRAIPLLCLVDLDPHGIEILATWKFGSRARAGQATHLAVSNLRWLGVHVETIADVMQHAIAMTRADFKKLETVLSRDWCVGAAVGKSWRQQVLALKDLQVKAEIEILAEKRAGLLDTLTDLVQTGDWL